MKARPINLRDWQVCAALAGRLSQIWVPMTPQPRLTEGAGLSWRGGVHGIQTNGAPYLESIITKCPFGRVGDRLWGRETWQRFAYGYDPIPAERFGGQFAPFVGVKGDTALHWRACYRADGPLEHPTDGPARWCSPIGMPRWASRLTLELLSVDVAQVQTATEDDARACGIIQPEGAEACPCQGDEEDPGPHIAACPWRDVDYDPIEVPLLDEMAIRWNEQHKRRAPWSAKPWAWVLGVKVTA